MLGLSSTIMCCAAGAGAAPRLRMRLGENQISASVLVDLGWREARWTMAGSAFQLFHQLLVCNCGKTLLKHQFELVHSLAVKRFFDGSNMLVWCWKVRANK